MASYRRNRRNNNDGEEDESGMGDYWRRKSYPWDKDAQPRAKRGREKKKENGCVAEVYNILSHQMCPLCKLYRGTSFLQDCGHGMMCPTCSEKCIKRGRCPFCRTLVYNSITYTCHE